VFAKVREKARQTSCASNLKQIGLAAQQYVEDYDETFPFVNFQSTSINGAQCSMFYEIYPYIKSAQVFSCPSNPVNQVWAGYANPGQGPVGYPPIPASYAMPYQLFSSSFGAPHTDAWLQEPSAKLMFTESNTGYPNLASSEPLLGWDNWNSGSNFTNEGFAGHTGTMNVCFCDGHVKNELPQNTAGANGIPSMWGKFGDTPNDSTCPSGVSGSDEFNCDGYSPGATAALYALSVKYM